MLFGELLPDMDKVLCEQLICGGNQIISYETGPSCFNKNRLMHLDAKAYLKRIKP